MEPYEKAYELVQRAEDARDWKMGLYFKGALSVVLSGMFDKNSKAKYFERPILEEVEMCGEGISEEVKQREVDRFFEQQEANRREWMVRHDSGR